MTRRSRLAARPRLELLDTRRVLSAVTPAQLDAAYGLNAVTFSNGTIKGTGEGQTIAIVDAYVDPTIYADLTAFDKANNLPNPTLASTPAANSPSSTALPSFTALAVNGATASDSGWNEEEALDVEMAHAAAPGANIVLVEAPTASTTGLLGAITSVLNNKSFAGVSVVSMSWGSSEFSGETAYDKTFTTPVGHTGVTFIASAGDSGYGAEWPAASPNVVGVGGTTLNVTSTGTVTSQAGWSGSGGGTSQVEAKPSYQKSVPGSYRSTPDVVVDADPDTGVMIYSGGSKTPIQVGGTSLSSPVFAGLIAIADQGLAVAGKSSLDGPTQTLPDLYGTASGSFTAVQGATTRTFGRHGTTVTTPTGLGSPNAVKLVASLDGTPTSTTTTGTTGTGTTGTGTTGTGTGSSGGSGTTTTTGGGGTTTGGGGGGGTTTGGSNHGRGSWGFFGSGGSKWWNDYFARSSAGRWSGS